MNYLAKFLSNNGHLRGLLYFSLASLPIVCTALEAWAKQAPPNWYAVAAVLLSAIIAGLVSLRAYLDQHLSRNAPEPVEPPKP